MHVHMHTLDFEDENITESLKLKIMGHQKAT